ncbi:MAG: hypothetical protein K8R60_15345 [Burkholderiales bacterium]|nr:hypothetical protein [Burkholderiales bacterium]
MTASNSEAADAATPLSPEAQAVALWTFVHLRVPRFASADALAVVKELAPAPHENVKALAKRLRQAMASRGIAFKHTHALDAASRLLGHENWHVAARDSVPMPLEFVSHFAGFDRPLASWEEAVQLFSEYCEGEIEGGGMYVYQLGFTPNSVTLDSPLMQAKDKQGRTVPMMQVRWQAADTKQLAAAVSAIETLRRRYEETGRGLIDGLAATQYCLHTPHTSPEPEDPVNSELVVVDVTQGPSFGDEVARGDEVKCWSELQKVRPTKDAEPYLFDAGLWAVGNTRYEWRLTTIRPGALVPTILTRPLSADESARLFRRHQRAVRAGRYFVPEDRVKSMSAVALTSLGVDVDWERVGLEAVRTLTSDQELVDAIGRPTLRGRLSFDEFFRVCDTLRMSHPANLIRKPKRSELVLLGNDELLRTFVSRIHDAVYEVPRRLDETVVRVVDSAVNMFLTALRNDVVTADGVTHDSFPRNDPYMVFANQGKDLLATLKRHGLVAYGGLTTNVQRLRGAGPRVNGAPPFKLEHVLFLDIDFEESKQ